MLYSTQGMQLQGDLMIVCTSTYTLFMLCCCLPRMCGEVGCILATGLALYVHNCTEHRSTIQSASVCQIFQAFLHTIIIQDRKSVV